ncbi:MAG: energy transducer TonB [Acidobacteriota bacterium]|nr:energy transducer TonB [Blastocatellia bacterium]MDW8239697.1 energy transducer TonB [Acidobacteriota bacterium]
MKEPTFVMFAPLEEESLLTRLGHELRDSSRDFLADPRGYIRSTFSQDAYGKRRARVIFLGSVLTLFLLVLSVGIGALLRFLHTPEIVSVLETQAQKISYVEPPPLTPLPAAPKQSQRAGGGGGGGNNEPNPPSFGRLPRAELTVPLISPTVHQPKIKNPSLPVEPTIMAQPELIPKMDPNLPLGDPSSRSLIPSDGPGSGGGIGTGKGGGVGSGDGLGVGPGKGFNIGGGNPSIGGGDRDRDRIVQSRPQILNRPKPDWTEEAHRNRIQGEVVLSATFAADGTVRDIRVIRGLGYGLDEKAIEAAKLIKFIPARDQYGRPIDVRQRITVDFRLL